MLRRDLISYFNKLRSSYKLNVSLKVINKSLYLDILIRISFSLSIVYNLTRASIVILIYLDSILTIKE